MRLFRALKRRIPAPQTSGGDPLPADFPDQLRESLRYVRRHGFRVLSTELPDELLHRWLLPDPGETDAEEYMRQVAERQGPFRPTPLARAVFEDALHKRFGRGIEYRDVHEQETAACDLEIFVLLLSHIFGMRGSGCTPEVFDLFDLDAYPAVSRRIEACAAPASSWDEERYEREIINARNTVLGDLMQEYTDDILRLLDNRPEVEIGRTEDLVVRVILREMAHFDMNPALSMRDNSADMFVERIEKRDGESIAIHLTEADAYLDDLLRRRVPWGGLRRTERSHTLVITRGKPMTAPFITLVTFAQIKNAVRRHDAYERGLRKSPGLRNAREREAEAAAFADDLGRAAVRHGIEITFR